tara:strand:+ start:710 stop:964 length:255 start_codon:yes stop_codon:yes gene_type:complete
MKQVLMYTGDYCPHCKSAKALLESKNVTIKEIDVWKDEGKRAEMQGRTGGAKTIPQIFIGDYYVGGNDELQILNRQGKLDQLLK